MAKIELSQMDYAQAKLNMAGEFIAARLSNQAISNQEIEETPDVALKLAEKTLTECGIFPSEYPGDPSEEEDIDSFLESDDPTLVDACAHEQALMALMEPIKRLFGSSMVDPLQGNIHIKDQKDFTLAITNLQDVVRSLKRPQDES